MSKIQVNIVLDEERDMQKIFEDVKRHLRVTSDWQYDNIVWGLDEDGKELTMNIFPDQFREQARSRSVMRNLMEYLMMEVL